MDYLRGLLGLLFLLGIAVVFSSNRQKIDWRLVGSGLILQLVLAIIMTQTAVATEIFATVSGGFIRFLEFSRDGAIFIFSGLAKNSFADEQAGHQLGVIFAFQVLPVIIFVSAVSSGLYYLGILQKIVFGIAWVMSRTMRLSGAESMSTAGNIFLGQTEAPLLVRPFIANMSRSEIMCLMTGGMATIAGSVLGAYVSFLGGDDAVSQQHFAVHLLRASILNAPAAIILSKILVPETEKIDAELRINTEKNAVNLIDALASGAADGLKLALNVGAMLMAFVAIIFMLNFILQELIGASFGINNWIKESTNNNFQGLSLEYILGQFFRPIAFMIGVDWSETLQVGSLLGQKTAINEFVAYANLGQIKDSLSSKSIIISTYALCGFSNFSSIAIQIGGIGGMAPNQQGTLSQLGMKALLGASLACLMTATIAGAIL